MIAIQSGSHYYTKEGKPSHDADLRVARKEKLFVSPTTIDKAEYTNPALDKWKMEELAKAAFLSPPQPHESIEEFSNRIYQLSLEKARTAANFGTEIHDAIEHYPQLPMNQDLMPYIDFYHEWYRNNIEYIIYAERVLVDDKLGVAGRTDIKAMHKTYGKCMIDIKTQNMKKDAKGRKKPNFYDSWARQLSFYAAADSKLDGTWPLMPVCINAVFDSNEPGPPVIKVWDNTEIISAYQDFVIGAFRWFKSRDYWPVGKWDVAPTIEMPIAQ